MNKKDFLNKLSSALYELPSEELRRTIDYYSEIIDDAVEDGEDEQTVISRLGSIDKITQKIINESPGRKFTNQNIHNKISPAAVVLIIISSPIWLPILIAVFAVVFSVYISVWSIIVLLFAISIGLAVTGLASLITSPFLAFAARHVKALFLFGSALTCIGMSNLMFYAALRCSKLIIKFTVFLIMKSKDIFKKKGCEIIECK